MADDDYFRDYEFTSEDYKGNWVDRIPDIEDSVVRKRVFSRFYDHVWNLLFGPDATEESQALAVELLVVGRPNAAFMAPFEYNDWIRRVRDEIIKRDMSELWKREFIPKELGLIWVRDSDYFSDWDDPEPKKFYKLRDSDPEMVFKKYS